MKRFALSALLALFVSFAFVAPASAGPGNNIPNTLSVYLNLSRQQNADANQILANFYEFSGNKFNRYSELDRQITYIRNDHNLDPLTIGLRMGNLIGEEVQIERDVDLAASKAQKSLVGLLNPVQISLLSRLVDAMNLSSTGWAAVSANFLAPPAPQYGYGGGPVPSLPSVGMASVRPTGSTAFEILFQAYRQQHPVAAEIPVPDTPISTE